MVDWRRERFGLMKILRQAGLQIVNKSDATQDEEIDRRWWFFVARRKKGGAFLAIDQVVGRIFKRWRGVSTRAYPVRFDLACGLLC